MKTYTITIQLNEESEATAFNELKAIFSSAPDFTYIKRHVDQMMVEEYDEEALLGEKDPEEDK